MKRRAHKGTGNALEAVAEAFNHFRPARDVLHEVQAVPTRFVQFDHASRVGGFPTERFSLVHGPSNEGKSAYVLGLIESFLSGQHPALYIDAERTTPITWARQLMGPMADSPGFYADRPKTYEGTISKVREFLNLIANLKAKGKLPPQTQAIVVVDSLRKLVPADLMKEIIQSEKDLAKDITGKKISAGRDRAAQIKAKMNAAWMDELIPLLEYASAACVAIAREMVDPDANPFLKKFGNDYKVGGGGAIYYDASLVMRVERWGWIQKSNGEDQAADIFGERHKVTIKKTKIGGKDKKVSTCAFHTSNGQHVPFGFDRARDVLSLAQQFEMIGKTRGGWLTFEGQKWQGEHSAVLKLTEDPGMLREVEIQVRAAFKDHRPEEHDEETGEVT